MFKLKKGKPFETRCTCRFCGKETKDELHMNYRNNNGQVIRICESCQLNLLTVLHRGVNG